MNAAARVGKLRNDCKMLRDGRMSQGDRVEQLTYLLFRKNAGLLQLSGTPTR